MLHRHWAVVSLFLLAGCQTYEPMAVDLNAHDRDWADRNPSGMLVSEFAKELGALNAAQPRRFDPADGFSLPEAEVIALMFNPNLRTARLRARVPLAGAGEAGRWEDPRIDVDALRVLESVSKPWVLGAAIGFTIPISGKLAVEKDKASAEADVEVYRAWLAEIRVLAELREAWVRRWVISNRITQTQAYLAQLDAIIPVAEQQRRLGKIGSTSKRVFQIEKATRAAELASLQADEARLELAIKALLGLKPEAPLRIEAGPATAFNATTANISPADHPRLLLFKAEYSVAEWALQLEIRRQYPDLEIGPAYEFDEGVDKAGLALSLPLPLLNANRRAIAEARAARDAAKAAIEGEYEAITGEVAAARAAVAAASVRRLALESTVVPLVDQQLEDLRKQAALGEFDALLYLDALTRSYEAKLQVLDAHLDEATQSNALRSLIEPAVQTKTLNDLSTKDVKP